MKKAKSKSSKASLADVAKAAGISTVAASYAMRNKPGISDATRAKVLRIAQEMDYVPDARIDAWMARMRESKNKDLLPLVWFNHHRTDRDAWKRYKFLSPYLEGARERSHLLGYRLEEVWACEPGLTPARLSKILYNRGIEGVVVTHFSEKFQFDWAHFAAVSLEGSLPAPSLPGIFTDHLFNFQLSLKKVREAGYLRIGACIANDLDIKTDQSIRAAITHYNSSIPRSERVEPVFYPWGGEKNETEARASVIAWLKKSKPDAIIGLNSHLIEWAAEAGYRVPEDLAVVHIANDDDVSDWAGVCSNRREIGAAAISMLISRIHNRQFGIPSIASRTLIRGSWCPGFTMIDRQGA